MKSLIILSVNSYILYYATYILGAIIGSSLVFLMLIPLLSYNIYSTTIIGYIIYSMFKSFSDSMVIIYKELLLNGLVPAFTIMAKEAYEFFGISYTYIVQFLPSTPKWLENIQNALIPKKETIYERMKLLDGKVDGLVGQNNQLGMLLDIFKQLKVKSRSKTRRKRSGSKRKRSGSKRRRGSKRRN